DLLMLTTRQRAGVGAYKSVIDSRTTSAIATKNLNMAVGGGWQQPAAPVQPTPAQSAASASTPT
ncbi:MAG: hypothetical protein VW625_07130, partial [Perlucidibaca sp.]